MEREGKRVFTNARWCKGCGICVAFCPQGVLGLVKQKIAFWNRKNARAAGCARCAARTTPYGWTSMRNGAARRRKGARRNDAGHAGGENSAQAPPGAVAGQRSGGRRCSGGGHALFRRLSHHALYGDRRGLRAEAAPRGRQVHPDGGRTGKHGGGHRRVGGGRQVHDGHLRPRFFAETGEHRLRGAGGDPLRGGGCAALRPLHGPADFALAGRLHAGALGHATATIR